MTANEYLDTFVNQQVAQMARKAYQLQGDDAFVCTKRAAALHECGHALVFHLTANDILSPPYAVEIRETSKGVWEGFASHRPNYARREIQLDKISPKYTLLEGVRTLSGYCAEWLFDQDDFRIGSSPHDVALTTGLANIYAQLAGGSYSDAFEIMQTLAMDMLDANASLVKSMASRLERAHRMEEAELRHYLASAEKPLSLMHFLQ